MATLDRLEVLRMVVRTVHFASSVGLFGAFVFFSLIAGPSRSEAASASRDTFSFKGPNINTVGFD